MADDLKLSVVIEALLNAKGFEDAKTALKGMADQAAASAPKTDKAGDSAKKMGESYGGSRGPVADLTRILLQNVGVTGAAGEAAKAAGTAVYFMEGAATAANVAIGAGVAGFALLLPKLLDYFTSETDAAEATRKLQDEILDSLPSLREYREAFSELTRLQRGLLQIKQEDALRKQKEQTAELAKRASDLRAEIEKLLAPHAELTGRIQRGGAATFRMVEASDEAKKKAADLSVQVADLEVEIAALNEATLQGSTLQDAFGDAQERARAKANAHTEATREQTKAVRQLTLAEKMAIEQELDAIADRVTYTQRQDKARAKAEAIETRRILDRMELEREDERQQRALAEAKRINALQAVSYAGQALTALSQLFGKNKALAIAGAIADTYAGAALALRTIPPPAGWAAAAATIAMGLANIQQIRKAEPVGFDDPFADLTARKLGRRSAEDFAREFGGTFSRMLPGEMVRQGATYHHTTINRGVTHNYGGVHGLLAGSPAAFARGLDRAMTKAERYRRRTTLGR